MEYLRNSVNLRAYGQRDPLTEYKREGLRYFKDMEASTEGQILSLMKSSGLNCFCCCTSSINVVKRLTGIGYLFLFIIFPFF